MEPCTPSNIFLRLNIVHKGLNLSAMHHHKSVLALAWTAISFSKILLHIYNYNCWAFLGSWIRYIPLAMGSDPDLLLTILRLCQALSQSQ